MTTLDLSASQQARLDELAERVATSPHNLVSRRARGELRRRHVPESVLFARLLPDRGRRVLDVGSGGGFPGLVAAIVRPDLEMHLLDATQKKVTFLRETIDALELAVTVHHGRAEELARGQLAQSFDVVTARAVAPLKDLLELTVPFLIPGGTLYAVKGDRWAAELGAASDALRGCGATVLATPDDLPQPDGDPEDLMPRVVIIGRSR